jgi:hypothetical protein
MAQTARRADSLDEYWTRFSRQCLSRSARTSGDRQWFAVWERRVPTDAVSPACSAEFDGFRGAATALQTALVQADEAARQAGVFPGTRRELRERYRLDWDGWDR